MRTLFDRPLSHTGDPETSYIAADKMVKSGALNKQEWDIMFAIRRYKNVYACDMKSFCPEHEDFTARELSNYSGINYYTIQRRLSSLRHKGKIERTGEKRNGCAVWAVI